MGRLNTVVATLTIASGSSLQAQSLAQRVAGAPDGRVAFSFAARPGVCGNGAGFIGDGRHFMTIGRDNFSMSDEDEGRCPCEPGPVRVTLEVRRHRLVELRTAVGRPAPTGPGVTDLGTVPASAASSYLLTLARGEDEEVGHDAVFPATLADSVTVWPDLLNIARSTSVPRETRQTAVFWVSQAAGDAATRGLDSLVADERGDRDIREQAVFALSQRPADEGVPILIRIARTNRDPEIRRKALFWLGQSEDPRAISLFEEILTRR